MAIQEIFSVPIYKIKLDLDVKKLRSFCDNYRRGNLSWRKDREDKCKLVTVKSNRGGYHSNNLSLDEVILQPLIEEVETHSSKFANTFINQNKQVIDGMWFNVNLYKDSNASHRHSGADISGVYYIKTPNDCGNLVFENPAIDLFDYYFLSHPKELNHYSASRCEMLAEVNMLYLFPSWLKHLVEPNKNKMQERLSIAFNTNQLEFQKVKNIFKSVTGGT